MAKEKKTPRNEFHFYLQRATANQCYVQKNKKKIIARNRKYKEKYDY